MRDDYYTIRTRDLSDLPLPSRPSPVRAALLFSSAALAIAVLVVPELGSRRLDVAGFWPGANPGIDAIAVGSVDPSPSSADPFGLRGARRVVPARLPGAAAPSPSVETRSYVVRRSVLSEGSVCVIQSDGTRAGAC